MGEKFAEVAASGPLFFAMAAAAIAGLVSFLSPCVLPLVPGYLSYATSLSGASVATGSSPGDADRATGRPNRSTGRVVAGTLGFILGFTIFFVFAVVFITSVGRFALANQRAIEIVSGVAVIILGLGFLGLIPLLQRQAKMSWLPKAGVAGSPLLGMVFALSWTPCVSPTLGAVMGLALAEDSMIRSAILAIAYCVGLGIPFLGVGLGIRRLVGLTRVVRRYNYLVTRIGGAFIVIIGVALVTGVWESMVIWLRVTFGNVGLGV